MRYRIIYPCGDRTKLSVVYAVDYEDSDYDLASRKIFPDDAEGLADARTYAKKLAEKHGLVYVADRDETQYLD